MHVGKRLCHWMDGGGGRMVSADGPIVIGATLERWIFKVGGGERGGEI
jgi:hypothetical protein